MTTSFDRKAALAILDHADHRLTARAYVHEIARQMHLPVSDAKSVLKTLVHQREITYQDVFGTTCVIQNFQKPVRITDHFVLIPPDISNFNDRPDVHTICLEPGISFGSGHHPTTRLCLAALEHLFYQIRPGPGILQAPAADIGTGSGVLAIAMCLAGVSTCLAYDIDPNAVSEAGRNTVLNHLPDRISVKDHPIPETGPGLGIICANLRTPTLETLAPVFRHRLISGGFLVFSGIRSWEVTGLKTCFTEHRFRPVWENTDKDWVGLVLKDH
jgi:ribosomal protein L11 methyltransferase